jgi:hypothetical protein
MHGIVKDKQAWQAGWMKISAQEMAVVRETKKPLGLESCTTQDGPAKQFRYIFFISDLFSESCLSRGICPTCA